MVVLMASGDVVPASFGWCGRWLGWCGRWFSTVHIDLSRRPATTCHEDPPRHGVGRWRVCGSSQVRGVISTRFHLPRSITCRDMGWQRLTSTYDLPRRVPPTGGVRGLTLTLSPTPVENRLRVSPTRTR